MPEHTPGPWTAIEEEHTYVIRDADDDPVVWEYGGIDNEANAWLIAAAPDLLAVCIGILECLDEKDRWTSVSRKFAAESLRKAIAKARGE